MRFSIVKCVTVCLEVPVSQFTIVLLVDKLNFMYGKQGLLISEPMHVQQFGPEFD